MRAADVHSFVVGRWPDVLPALGINASHLTRRHGPCPACGGKDRFRFDDRDGRGTFYCNKCGAGDGFRLLQVVHGWSFREALRAVIDAAGLRSYDTPAPSPAPTAHAATEIAAPTPRVRRLLRTATAPDMVPDAIAYLRSRSLWPLPAGCTLQAHAGFEYCEPGHGSSTVLVGRYPALVGRVVDVDGETVSAHVSYISDGAKLSGHEPRKLLSPLTGRQGCAVRLLPLAGDVLGVGEGIETCLSAAVLHGVPVWSCLSDRVLTRFVPPPEIRHVLIFADRDVAGMEAAWTLREELDGRCTVELRLPPPKFGDWNDAHQERT